MTLLKKIIGRHPTATLPGIIGEITFKDENHFIVKYPENTGRANVAISKLQIGEIGEKTPYVVFQDFNELFTIESELVTLWKTIKVMSEDLRLHMNSQAKESWRLRPKGDF